MPVPLNETHDATLRSWVDSANAPNSSFPIQNLPYGVFRRRNSHESFRIGIAIGDHILDLYAAQAMGAFAAVDANTCRIVSIAAESPTLNRLMAQGVAAWSALRLVLSRLLRAGAKEQAQLQACLVKQAEAEYSLPAQIGDYTDFYTSIYHATAVGKLFRPDQPLLPNYKWVPIGYHGRSSSIVVSGHNIHRPLGQTKAASAMMPTLGPSKQLDYELEVGVFIGHGNAIGQTIPLNEAESHIFGLCLLNDWSARDIQAWEYQPLGPFLAKNFATSISPWVVSLEALAPYRTTWTRPGGDPQPLAYLDSQALRSTGAFDLQLEVFIETQAMRDADIAPQRLSVSNFRDAYWSVLQLVAHHTVGGCNLCPGDLFGSGTQSGPRAQEAGSLLELTLGGKQPIKLPNDETRLFLEEGDTIIMRGYAYRLGLPRVGLGEVVGTVLSTHPFGSINN